MKPILHLLGLLAGVLLFCVSGFLAACEPMRTVTRRTWRAICSVTGLSTLAGMAFTWRGLRRKEIA